MKEINISRGQVAIVDDADYEFLNQWKWQANWSKFTRTFYAQRETAKDYVRTHFKMHRMVMGINDSNVWVDHINHDTLDNRRSNLRLSSRAKNASNSRLRSDNVAGLKGVHWDKRGGYWAAAITVNRKQIHLGVFRDPKIAHEAYMAAARKHHGEFAHSGIIE